MLPLAGLSERDVDHVLPRHVMLPLAGAGW